ncbi:MAG: hypothetical protein H0T42_33210, partial [Deltaproteobacteria bacterium]|nr:hypothetical protein [Deltaproteobacteria bacterium]
LAVIGCGGTAAPPSPPLAHHTTPPPVPADAVAAGPCAGDLRWHRETLVRTRETTIAASGERATYRGWSHDNFDDGSTAIVLSLDVSGQPWLPDARDRSVHAFGDHCLRIFSATSDRLELDVALQPAHEYDPHRCHMGCCRSEAQSRTPDGTEECCFCSDDPTP